MKDILKKNVDECFYGKTKRENKRGHKKKVKPFCVIVNFIEGNSSVANVAHGCGHAPH